MSVEASSDRPLFMEERIHSDTWWKVKTGLKDAQIVARKNALLICIRSAAPNKSLAIPLDKLVDYIEPLVATFDDSRWCLPTEQDRAVRFAEQLRLYTLWAGKIHLERQDMSANELYTIPTASAMLKMEEIMDSTTSHAPSAGGPNKPVFDWNDVEVYLHTQVNNSNERTLHIPMTDLRPGKMNEPCHWSGFSFQRFLEYVQREAGDFYTLQNCEFIWITSGDHAFIDTSGNYKIMLKRFSERPIAMNGVINLIVKDRGQYIANNLKLPSNRSPLFRPRP